MATRNKLLLNVDSQIDFVMEGTRLPVAGAENIIVEGIRFLMNLDPAEYAAAVFTFDTHEEEAFIGSDENVGDEAAGRPGFPIHCEYGHPGWESVFNPWIIPEAITKFELRKTIFDMWGQPEDEVILHRMERYTMSADQTGHKRDVFFNWMKELGVDTVTVMGVASDFCVKDAIAGLLERGFKVEVVERLTAGILRDIRQTIADEYPGQVTLV